QRLSVNCKDGDWTCPSIWDDDEIPEDVIAVGRLLDPSPVPLGPGKVAIRLPRQVVRDAGI
ncbi:MAG: hypothetical protein ACRDTT_07625, partial [Pseudonocardiaceae bacterium]